MGEGWKRERVGSLFFVFFFFLLILIYVAASRLSCGMGLCLSSILGWPQGHMQHWDQAIALWSPKALHLKSPRKVCLVYFWKGCKAVCEFRSSNEEGPGRRSMAEHPRFTVTVWQGRAGYHSSKGLMKSFKSPLKCRWEQFNVVASGWETQHLTENSRRWSQGQGFSVWAETIHRLARRQSCKSYPRGQDTDMRFHVEFLRPITLDSPGCLVNNLSPGCCLRVVLGGQGQLQMASYCFT